MCIENGIAQVEHMGLELVPLFRLNRDRTCQGKLVTCVMTTLNHPQNIELRHCDKPVDFTLFITLLYNDVSAAYSYMIDTMRP